MYGGLGGLRRSGRGRLLRPAGGPRPQARAIRRVWVHTHPGNFARAEPDRRGDLCPCVRADRLGRDVHPCPPGPELRPAAVPRRPRRRSGSAGPVDYSRPFAASDHAAWRRSTWPPCWSPRCRFSTMPSELPPGVAATLDPWDDDWFLAWDSQFLGEEPGFTR